MCDGPGVCRPVMGLPVPLGLWLKKFKSLFSSCCYSDQVLLAHCYSARVRKGLREWEAECGFQRQGAGCTGGGGGVFFWPVFAGMKARR